MKVIEIRKKFPFAEQIIDDALDNGQKVSVGEYRLTESGERGFMNATTGKADTFAGVWHTVECGNKAYYISDTTEGLDARTYKAQFNKGEMVLVVWERTGYVKGKGERHAGKIVRLQTQAK